MCIFNSNSYSKGFLTWVITTEIIPGNSFKLYFPKQSQNSLISLLEMFLIQDNILHGFFPLDFQSNWWKLGLSLYLADEQYISSDYDLAKQLAEKVAKEGPEAEAFARIEHVDDARYR